MAQDSGQSFGGFLTTMVGGATAAGSIIAAVTAAFAFQGQIAGILWKPLHVPVPLQVWATIALMLLLLLIVFAIWYGAIRQESRIADRDRFTLRASNRETLLGRDKDVEALTRVVLDNRLVLLDGESGCGKSALVAVGLLPALADDPAWLPVLCSEWREDWECGPLVTVTDALFRALQKEGRDAVGWKKGLDLTLPAEDLARELARQLVAVRAKLGGRRVLLVLDQFDDYQAQHRDRFVVTDRTWLTATDLLAQNAFWACLHAALKAGDLHCVLVTRADAAGGFACVRFVDIKSAAMTLELVKADRAEPILKRLAPDDADPPVVIRPDKGWHQLREMLAKELEARRALLMQQLRVLVLGLRELPALTVGHFRAAGGMAGVEAFYIRRAIEASVENRGQEPIARALLAPLIDPGDGVGQPKTRTLPQSALIGADGETETKLAILKALAKGEIVRPVPQAGIDEPAWRLDHDYLARAVITDARRVNRLSVRLEDGRHAFDAASGSLRLQFQALLEPWSWLRIGMQALRRRIALGPAGRYYLISGIKPALVLALLGVPPAILWETERRAEVERVFTAIGTNNHPGAALLEVWRGPEWLRDRLFARLAAPGSEVLFKNAIANGWVMADIGWDVGRARRMADTLRGRIGPDLDPNVSGLYSQSLATTVVAVPDPKLWADTLVFLRSQNFSRTDRVAAYETVLNRITDQKILEGEFDHFMKLATAVDQKELDSYTWSKALAWSAAKISDPKRLAQAIAAIDKINSGYPADDPDRYGRTSIAAITSDQKFISSYVNFLVEDIQTGKYKENSSRVLDTLAKTAARSTDREVLSGSFIILNQIIDIRNRADFPADQETSLTAPYAVIVKKLGDRNSIVEANRMMETLSRTITKTDPVYNMQYAITDYASIAALSDDRGHRLNALRFVYHWYQQYKDYDFGLAPAFATLYASIATPGRVVSSSGMYRSNLEQAEPDQQRLAWSRGLAILLGARMKIAQGDARKALVLDALQMMRSPMVSDPMPYVDAIEGLSGPLADRRPDTALAWAQKAYGIRREDLRPR